MLKRCVHVLSPDGEPVSMNMTSCVHGEPFVCVTDLLEYFRRLPYEEDGDELRSKIISELTLMNLAYSVNVDMETP
jgi:hypothetical protein